MGDLGLVLPAATFLSVLLLTLAVGVVLTAERKNVRQRVAPYVSSTGGSAAPPATIFRDQRLAGFESLNRVLAGTSFAERVAIDLARADLPLKVGEYLLLRWFLAVALFVLVNSAMGIVGGVVAAIVGYFLPRLYLKLRQRRRLRLFNEQLVDALGLIANALRSGHSLLQGLELVAREMPDPTGPSFRDVVNEVAVGASIEDALERLVRRVPSEELYLVVTAMIIQRQVGGNLAELLDAAATTIRERMRILREVRVRTAQGRLSGIILGVLPFALAGIISLLHPTYLQPLVTHPIGIVLLVCGLFLELVGVLMIRRIVDIKV